MDHSKRNRTPEELDSTEDALRAGRHQATPLELDRIKLQAIRQAERPRPSLYAVKKGTLMKSRLALTLLLVAGFMLSTTGATLAISGSSGSGSAATNQYVQPHNEEGTHGEQGTKGATGKGGNENNTLNEEPATEVEVTPAPATEQQAVVSSGSSLPFTGFVAIPLLVIGVGMILVGATLRFKSRKDTPAGL
ncbi:MAG TPA: hypothetical protein VN522_05560 [Solirubrobacterales bacterium]|nr:hypothetical protein [Solirubrobacterales bacterium]